MLPRHFMYNFICAFRSLARPGLLANLSCTLVFPRRPCPVPQIQGTEQGILEKWGYRTSPYSNIKWSVPLFFCISLSCTLDFDISGVYVKSRVQDKEMEIMKGTAQGLGCLRTHKLNRQIKGTGQGNTEKQGYRSLYVEEGDVLYPHFSKISCPVLCIWGTGRGSTGKQGYRTFPSST